VLPEHGVVVVDEAHELVDRVTGVATAELTAGTVGRAVSRLRRLVPDEEAGALLAAGEALDVATGSTPEGRLESLPSALGAAVQSVEAATRSVLTALRADRASDGESGSRRLAWAAVEGVHATAARLAAESAYDVAWIAVENRRGPVLRVAPLSVAGLLRGTLFASSTVILTSATLELGGSFDVVAGAVGLGGDRAPAWRGLDVGSPFDYRRQGILYVARHLPPPGRDSMSSAALDELAALVCAAGGRTLGLFSSQRAASVAAQALRERLDLPVLCQGEDSTGELIRRFAASPKTCLLGTLSLWQGVDVPGSSLQLVVVDRIPFPRPDDPLMSARARAADAAGRNGFLSVTVAQAALRLAQGAGRLIRSSSDRGVVAVLDSRLATARYAGFLHASLPPFWYTTASDVVRRSLASIDATAPPPQPVRPRAPRGGLDGAVGPAKDATAAMRRAAGDDESR
jgi:ATP-dependent DNA helicase DinG